MEGENTTFFGYPRFKNLRSHLLDITKKWQGGYDKHSTRNKYKR
jgi:hypothetical protein